jgi:aminomethyltransferase
MKYTPLHSVHLSLGAEMFTSSAGYHMPLHYKNVEEEHRAVRERVGMMDISLMTRLDIKGEDALDLVQRLAVNDASKLSDGQLMYTTLCDERGNIQDDLTIWRFGAKHFRIVTSSIMRQRTTKWIQTHIDPGMDAYMTDVSSGLGMISVQGPRSRDTLQKISDVDLKQIGFFRFEEANFAGVPVLVARVGFTGELGFECYVATEDTIQGWNDIANAGYEFGILPYGFDVLDSLRYEKGYIFYGYEVTERNNPFECGLDKWIRFDKEHFIGKDALLKVKQKGPDKKLMGLEVAGDSIASSSEPVKVNGENAGEVVTGFRALSMNKNLAWAWLRANRVKIGGDAEVEIRRVPTPARIVDIRYYDPSGARLKM